MDHNKRVELESIQTAEKYLKTHRINELMNDLCAAVCFKKPENVREFLVSELQRRKDNPAKGSMLFEDSEIEAVFRISDLMQVGTISVTQAQQALRSIVNTQAQYDMVESLEFGMERVDLETFKIKVKQLFD